MRVIALALLVAVAAAYSMDFTFTLRPRRKLCFEEYFPENVMGEFNST